MTEETTLSKGEQTRQAIIEAAFDIFRERGYHGTSMRQIAERAGIALGGIYNHFTSKEDIFAEVFDAYQPYRRILPMLDDVKGDTVEEFVLDAAHHLRTEAPNIEEKILPLAFIELIEFQGRHFATIVNQFFPIILSFVQKFGQRRGKLRNIPVPIMVRMMVVTYIGFIITEIIFRSVPFFKEMNLNWYDGMFDIYLHGILERED
jgi:AcrR family transcriptional regulator